MSNDSKSICIIVPVYNEEDVIQEFYKRLIKVLDEQPEYLWHLLFVNDGSEDGTQTIIETFSEADERVSYIGFSRNFGKEVAMTAGLDFADGDAVIVIDADLQDPPELIPELVAGWEQGFDTVFAKRLSREGENWLKRFTATRFYRVIQRVSKVKIPEDTGDYRLLSRRAVNALKRLREQHRFMKGLFAWIGYPAKSISYHRGPRFAGNTKFRFWRLWNFALEGITSFTIAPLKIATYLGISTALFAFLYGAWIIFKTLVFGDQVQGFPTLMVTHLFLGGLQLIFIGIIGEYLGRIFNESKQRPLYLVQTFHPGNMKFQGEIDE